MSIIKKSLTEQEAAAHFVLYITKEAQNTWPTIHKNLKDTFKDKFIIEDEKTAAFDLALAAIAQDMQAVKNIFPKDQAERIEKWIISCLDTKDWGEYAIDEVIKYGEKFQKDIQNVGAGGDPLSAIPTRLLMRWLGNNIHNFDVEMNGKKTGIISPFLLQMVSVLFFAFLGTWKRLKDNFEIIEGDLPLDKKPTGLKDYQPELDDDKPDGTIQYYDEHGKLKEKWMPPEQLTELLKKSGGRKVNRVLIKGPWDGIKETWWELSNDIKKKFVDDKGFAYAISYYEKGELTYHFVTKRLWDKQEEIETITMDQNLSDDMKQAKIKRLLDD